jgi:hypothetical protein
MHKENNIVLAISLLMDQGKFTKDELLGKLLVLDVPVLDSQLRATLRTLEAAGVILPMSARPEGRFNEMEVTAEGASALRSQLDRQPAMRAAMNNRDGGTSGGGGDGGNANPGNDGIRDGPGSGFREVLSHPYLFSVSARDFKDLLREIE